MREKEDLRIRKTKATLYKAYIELISSKNKEQIKISDICKKANINRSTFYDHFKDKESLATSLLQSIEEDIKDEFNKITKTEELNDYLLKIIKRAKKIIQENAIIKKLLKSNPTLIHQMFSNIIKEIIIKELKNEYTNIPIESYALFYSEGLTSILLNQDNNVIELEGFKSILPNKK